MKVFIRFLFFLPIVYAAGNYDYFQLVQQWPPTVNGARPEPLNFTIHGLWPSNSALPDPPTDCSGSPFNESIINDLEPLLNIYWPNLTGDNVYFWGDQWNKSGTCSEDRFNEHEYFALALKLKNNIDILRYLDDAGIKPLPPKVVYRSTDISDVIENRTGHKPRLWCKDYNDLLEISVCYDVSISLSSDLDKASIDCPPQLLNNPRNQCGPCVGCGACVGFPPYPTKKGIDEK